jgi:hypothetical protein
LQTKKKHHDQISIIPVEDDSGTFHGNEYLQIYNSFQPESGLFNKFGIYEPGGRNRKMLTEDYLRRYGK